MSTPTMRLLLTAAACALGCAQAAAETAGQTTPEAALGLPGDTPGGELRLSWTGRRAAGHGPLAAANARAPGIAPPADDAALAEIEWRHTLRGRLGATPLALAGHLLAWHERRAGAAAHSDARFNELNLSADFGAWQASAGKKVSGWDVAHGFRPNDLVQQEPRRSLLPATPQGRPLLMLENFGADAATSLVWVNPQRLDAADDASRGPHESALALRVYRRHGALDAFAFARLGAHTGVSLGSAMAWVTGDELALHASARLLQRHDGWRMDPEPGNTAVAADPWRQATLGGSTQWLVGASWTGALQQSLLFEYWHDGTTLADADWDRWRARNAALAASTGPAPANAGNLAWQATPFDSASLRRDNLFVRLSWQPEAWQLAFDVLHTPADRGRVLTTRVQWQGDRWRLNAAWRVNGGPREALIVQLPDRCNLLLAATRAF